MGLHGWAWGNGERASGSGSHSKVTPRPPEQTPTAASPRTPWRHSVPFCPPSPWLRFSLLPFALRALPLPWEKGKTCHPVTTQGPAALPGSTLCCPPAWPCADARAWSRQQLGLGEDAPLPVARADRQPALLCAVSFLLSLKMYGARLPVAQVLPLLLFGFVLLFETGSLRCPGWP